MKKATTRSTANRVVEAFLRSPWNLARLALLCQMTLCAVGNTACIGPRRALPDFERREDELSVITFNVYGFPYITQQPSRLFYIAEDLRTLYRAVDIIALQEATTDASLDELTKSGGRHWVTGPCAHTAHHFLANPTGLMLLVRGEITEAHAFYFDEDEHPVEDGPAHPDACNENPFMPWKGFLLAKVRVHGVELYVADVHLTVASNQKRNEEIKAITSAVGALAKESLPIVLAGDLNSADAGAVLAHELQLTDQTPDAGPTAGQWPDGMIPGTPFWAPAQLDRILARRLTATKHAKRIFVVPYGEVSASDHYGVIVTLALDNTQVERGTTEGLKEPEDKESGPESARNAAKGLP